jgi:hypothetical protein
MQCQKASECRRAQPFVTMIGDAAGAGAHCKRAELGHCRGSAAQAAATSTSASRAFTGYPCSGNFASSSHASAYSWPQPWHARRRAAVTVSSFRSVAPGGNDSSAIRE